ncbi:DUF6879 family protein [Streptomyces sp. NPDC056390]|uniref:DUF6879 family protein n=1 Tax=Streptomyces sp. NPDC056390 TaxID=3345806 RepID=UPI0035E39C7F
MSSSRRVRTTAAAGKSSCSGWSVGHASTVVNVYAGEEVRWLPHQRASNIALPGNDFWLFDDQVIRWGYFSGGGAVVGHEISEDRGAAKLCALSAAEQAAGPVRFRLLALLLFSLRALLLLLLVQHIGLA